MLICNPFTWLGLRYISLSFQVCQRNRPQIYYVIILTKKLSWQWAQTTLHIPGTLGIGAWGGPDGAKLITLLQFCLGQAILTLVFLHIKRQLHGQRTYFRPGGAFLMGVASPQDVHFTTCCSLFPEISTRACKLRFQLSFSIIFKSRLICTKFFEHANSLRKFQIQS